ncbi:TPA: ANR family transcriptional regulator [Citrobacter koseri]
MCVLSDRARNSKPASLFMSHADRAVIAEQNGEFGKAYASWAAALLVAQRPVNAEWAGSRMEFCNNAAFRGWGVPGEG